MRHGLGRIWQKNNRKKDDSTASGNGGSLFFSAISDTSVGTGTVGHAVCHNFWANDEADESASAFSQTPQCHSASHRGNSVASGVTLDSGVLDARQPVWIGNLELREQEWLEAVRGLCRSVGEIIGVDTAYLENTVSGRLQEGLDSLEENILPGMLSQSMQYVQWFAELGGFLVTFLIASVLLAKDYDGIMNRLLDQEACHVLLEVICGIVRYIATFVKAQGIIMTTIAMTAAATLGIAGINHGILWGILAGILDALPFIGTGIVLVPLGVFQILEGNWGRAIVCGVLYLVCIFLREIMEPRLIGRKIGVSPIAVLVSLYAGIRLFGVWGIIKGPLGFVLIYETYHSLARMFDRQREQEQQE